MVRFEFAVTRDMNQIKIHDISVATPCFIPCREVPVYSTLDLVSLRPDTDDLCDGHGPVLVDLDVAVEGKYAFVGARAVVAHYPGDR
jgi:hypothetical protein